MGFLTKEQIEQIREMGLFDFLSKYGMDLEISKEDLIEMFKSFNYAVYNRDKKMEIDATEYMIEELSEED